MRLFHLAACALLLFTVQGHAQSLVLPAGIGVEPDKSLDLTYQIVEEFDENEKAIAGWDGNKLLYVVSVEKLPKGWVDPDEYLKAFERDFRAAGRTVVLKRSGTYRTASPLVGHFLEIQSKGASAETPFATQVLHFLTDGKTAYLGMATLVEGQPADRMLDDTRLLFQSTVVADPATVPLPAPKTEAPYVGTWKWAGPAPDGNTATGVIVLRPDLTFSSDVTVSGKVVFSGAGVWSVNGKRLLWNHVRSLPELPADLKKDEDEIVLLEGPRLVLRSKVSGKEREFLRQ